MKIQSKTAQTLNLLSRNGAKLSILAGAFLLLLTPAAAAKKKKANAQTTQKTIVFDTIRSNLDAISFYADSTKRTRFKHVKEHEQSFGGLIKGMDYNGVFYRAYPGTVTRVPNGGYQFSTNSIWDKYIALATTARILPNTTDSGKMFIVNAQTNGRFTAVTIADKQNSVAAFLYDEIDKRFLILDDRQISAIDMFDGTNAKNGFSIQINTTSPLTNTEVCGRRTNRYDLILDFDQNGNNCAPRNDIDKEITEISSMLNEIIVERGLKKHLPELKKISKRNTRQR